MPGGERGPEARVLLTVGERGLYWLERTQAAHLQSWPRVSLGAERRQRGWKTSDAEKTKEGVEG